MLHLVGSSRLLPLGKRSNLILLQLWKDISSSAVLNSEEKKDDPFETIAALLKDFNVDKNTPKINKARPKKESRPSERTLSAMERSVEKFGRGKSSSDSKIQSLAFEKMKDDQDFSSGSSFYSKQPLGIFKNIEKQESKLKVWNKLKNEELNLAFKVHPRNAFEEMIQLTQEGKLWTFPINNEAGLEEEAKVPFYEHVLLDHLLDGLPNSKPVKEFMEMLMIGITNNPYTTSERKKALVLWYVEYFKSKEKLLQQLGAM